MKIELWIIAITAANYGVMKKNFNAVAFMFGLLVLINIWIGGSK